MPAISLKDRAKSKVRASKPGTTPAVPGAGAKPSGMPGAAGDADIKYLQMLLNQNYGQQLVEDGIYGPRTHNALVALHNVLFKKEDPTQQEINILVKLHVPEFQETLSAGQRPPPNAKAIAVEASKAFRSEQKQPERMKDVGRVHYSVVLPGTDIEFPVSQFLSLLPAAAQLGADGKGFETILDVNDSNVRKIYAVVSSVLFFLKPYGLVTNTDPFQSNQDEVIKAFNLIEAGMKDANAKEGKPVYSDQQLDAINAFEGYYGKLFGGLMVWQQQRSQFGSGAVHLVDMFNPSDPKTKDFSSNSFLQAIWSRIGTDKTKRDAFIKQVFAVFPDAGTYIMPTGEIRVDLGKLHSFAGQIGRAVAEGKIELDSGSAPKTSSSKQTIKSALLPTNVQQKHIVDWFDPSNTANRDFSGDANLAKVWRMVGKDPAKRETFLGWLKSKPNFETPKYLDDSGMPKVDGTLMKPFLEKVAREIGTGADFLAEKKASHTTMFEKVASEGLFSHVFSEMFDPASEVSQDSELKSNVRQLASLLGIPSVAELGAQLDRFSDNSANESTLVKNIIGVDPTNLLKAATKNHDLVKSADPFAKEWWEEIPSLWERTKGRDFREDEWYQANVAARGKPVEEAFESILKRRVREGAGALGVDLTEKITPQRKGLGLKIFDQGILGSLNDVSRLWSGASLIEKLLLLFRLVGRVVKGVLKWGAILGLIAGGVYVGKKIYVKKPKSSDIADTSEPTDIDMPAGKTNSKSQPKSRPAQILESKVDRIFGDS
jgi:hypothetical protein